MIQIRRAAAVSLAAAAKATVAPPKAVDHDGKPDPRRRRRRRRLSAPQPRASDAERTVQLEDGFELFPCGSEHDDNDADGSGRGAIRAGCLRVRSQAASLDRCFASIRRSAPKAVSFGEVAVHSHAVILGDNPSAAAGPPLTVAWRAFDSQRVALDDYERLRPAPRPKEALLVPRAVREDWLRGAGYSRSDLRDAVALAERIQHQRAQSARDGAGLARRLRYLLRL